MLYFIPFLAGLTACAHGASTGQIPLAQETTRPIVIHESWNLDTTPFPNSTTPYLFDTFTSLLQRWQNTRYRNGHNIVPATVAPGTLLYHGRSSPEFPDMPEWTATDPEHSLMFCRTECYHITLVATRELKLLYFDGSSAAKMSTGSMDSQDIIAWGKVYEDRMFNEKERLELLCKWGAEFGLDGFVRMEMDFEIMFCDMRAGMEVVSFAHLQHPKERAPVPSPPEKGDEEETTPPPLPDDPPRQGRLDSIPAVPVIRNGVPASLPQLSVIEAGSWHNYEPGETRVQLDYYRLVSFYDLELAPSLAVARAKENVTRYEHRILEITDEEAQAVKSKVESVLRRKDVKKSGVDWKALFGVVVNRYADRLELLDYLINNATTDSDVTLLRARELISIMLAPYILKAASNPETMFEKESMYTHAWAEPVYQLCTEMHTKYIGYGYELTESEELLKDTIRGTEREICRVLVKMWAVDKEAQADTLTIRTNKAVLDEWDLSVKGLMKWLDWGIWAKCRPACSFEEMCYLPTWPFFRRPGRPRGPRGPDDGHDNPLPLADDDDNDYERSEPRCIRRIDPFTEV